MTQISIFRRAIRASDWTQGKALRELLLWVGRRFSGLPGDDGTAYRKRNR